MENSIQINHMILKLDNYLSNPKLVFRVKNPENIKASTVMLSLTQKKDLLKKAVKQLTVEYTYCIRLDVYKVWFK